MTSLAAITPIRPPLTAEILKDSAFSVDNCPNNNMKKVQWMNNNFVLPHSIVQTFGPVPNHRHSEYDGVDEQKEEDQPQPNSSLLDLIGDVLERQNIGLSKLSERVSHITEIFIQGGTVVRNIHDTCSQFFVDCGNGVASRFAQVNDKWAVAV